MSRLTYDKIRIQGNFGMQSLHELRFCVAPNRHGLMEFTGVINIEVGFTELERQILNTTVSAVELDESGAAKAPALFSGVVRQVDIFLDGGVYHIRVSAFSASYLLDMQAKSRSFQDIGMTYKDVVLQVLADTPHAHAIFSVGADTPIGTPLIQYKETDWEFIRRLASHFNSPIIPETTECLPRLWFGMRQGEAFREFDDEKYRVKVDGKYYALGGESMGWRRRDFLYYEVESDSACEIGDNSDFLDKRLKICEKAGEFRHGEFFFIYKLARESFTSEKLYYNESIRGMSLFGTVLATDREVLKIHLDIDERQDEGTAYSYHWKPTTGNLMYLMPQVGTRVSLYMCDSDERSAVAINCVRTNGSVNPETADYNKRYLTTEHQKRLYMFPTSMGLVGTSGTDTGLMIQMDDSSGILFQSHQKTTITAADSITMSAPQVTMNCPQQLTLKQSGVSLVINNQFDVVGAKGRLSGSGPLPGVPRKEEEQDNYLRENSSFDWCGQAGTVLGGAASMMNQGEGFADSELCALAMSSAGTVSFTPEAIPEVLKGGPVNSGKHMAGGAAGGAIVSVTGGAPSKNPAAPPPDAASMQNRITEIKGLSAGAQRAVAVPREVEMVSPELIEGIFVKSPPSPQRRG